MKVYALVLSCIVISGVLASCGGGSSTVVLGPKPIPSEYQGLSMKQLKSKSSNIAYSDIIGTTSGEVITRSNDPKIAESIMKHEGSLFFFNGTIETVYPSSEEGTFTLWFCSSEGTQDIAYREGNKVICIDPLFLLYNVDRGPELQEGDSVNISGTIVGTRGKPGSGIKVGAAGDPLHRIPTFTTPSMSVIKAELAGQ